MRRGRIAIRSAFLSDIEAKGLLAAFLKKNGFALDRKVLAQFASEHPEVFARIAKKVV